jgi:hypothetical protein
VSGRGRNWTREAWRARARRYGADCITGSTPRQLLLELPLQRRRHSPTKSELRLLGQRALAAWRSRRQ